MTKEQLAAAKKYANDNFPGPDNEAIRIAIVKAWSAAHQAGAGSESELTLRWMEVVDQWYERYSAERTRSRKLLTAMRFCVRGFEGWVYNAGHPLHQYIQQLITAMAEYEKGGE